MERRGDQRPSWILIDFLKEKFNLSWLDKIDNVKIWKNGNELIISNRANAIFITLDITNTKAILRTRGQANFEFIVEVHSPDSYVILAPSEPIEKLSATFLIANIKRRIPSLIFGVLLNVVEGSSDFRILTEDKKFMQIAELTKKKLDYHFERFTSR